MPIRPAMEKRGIGFIAQAATKIVPSHNQLNLGDGSTAAYDYLAIAIGPKLAFDEVSGSGPHNGHTHSICTVEHAQMAHEGWGGIPEATWANSDRRHGWSQMLWSGIRICVHRGRRTGKRRLRHKVPMIFVTSEPYIGHLGLGGVGNSQALMEDEMRTHHIKWITNAKVSKVEPGKMFVAERDGRGEVAKQHELPFNFSMMLPAFKGVDAVATVEGLTNPRGFVLVDEYQRSRKYPNIYSAGVCIAIPPVEVTPVPTGAPKTGYMIETMVTAIVHNIKNAIEGRQPDATGTWNAICLVDMGDKGVAFVAIPQIPPRNVSWMKKGRWVHWSKIAFEKYFFAQDAQRPVRAAVRKVLPQSPGYRASDLGIATWHTAAGNSLDGSRSPHPLLFAVRKCL